MESYMQNPFPGKSCYVITLTISYETIAPIRLLEGLNSKLKHCLNLIKILLKSSFSIKECGRSFWLKSLVNLCHSIS